MEVWTERWESVLECRCTFLSACGSWIIASGRDPGAVLFIRDESGESSPSIMHCRGDHLHPISATAICDGIAASCSRDAVVFWDLVDVANTDLKCVGRTLPLEIAGDVLSARFDFKRSIIAIVDDNDTVRMFDVRKGVLIGAIQHRFCCDVVFISESNLLVTIGEDCSYRIWNCETFELTYQSMVLCGSPIRNIVSHPILPRFAIASVDGHVYVFESVTDSDCRFMGRINLFRVLEDDVNDNDADLRKEHDSDGDDDSLVMSMTLINMEWVTPTNSPSMIVFITSTTVCAVNGDSMDLITHTEQHLHDIGVPGSCAISENGGLIAAVLSGAFSSGLISIQLNTEVLVQQSLTNLTMQTSSTQLSESSPLLNSMFTSKTKAKPKKGTSSLDRPILFHSRVKSSGYGPSSQPKVKMFTRPGAPSSLKSKKTKRCDATSSARPAHNYPIDCELICQPQEVAVPGVDPGRPIHCGPINYVSFSKNGQSFLTCSTDSTTRLHKSMASKHHSLVLTGHTGSVRSCNWSSAGNMVATASVDKTVAIYLLPRLDPVCRITHTHNNFVGNSSIRQNSLLPSEVGDALFFYSDTFIITCCRNDVSLYKYRLGTPSGTANDLARPYQDYRFSRVANYRRDTESNGTVTRIAARNSRQSHIVMGATRNREILVIDMAVGGQVVRTITGAHSRPAHSIVLADEAGNVPISEQQVFCSAAADGTVKLWDVRMKGAVRRFVGHTNRQKQVGLGLSPCMRYIAVGSEDNLTFMYDIGSGRYLARLKSHRDAVSALAFNPAAPQLITTAYDGTIACYTA